MTPDIRSLADYQAAYARSLQDPDAYWGEVAQQYHWHRPWEAVQRGSLANVDYQWFAGGQTNLCYNCIDRHLPARGDQPALIWEPNDPAQPSRTYTYNELHAEVCQIANALRDLGVAAGDRVCIYLPMVPQAAMAMLACARIGAVHSVVFAGFSAQSLADRIQDSECCVLLTADGFARGAKHVSLIDIVAEALPNCHSLRHVLVLQAADNAAQGMPSPLAQDTRCQWWHDVVPQQPTTCEAVPMDAEAPLFILYTSGSTGRPKGIVHATGGYMVYVGHTFRNVFQYQPGDVYWCSADVGWVTGHSYLVYGPLLAGGTTVVFAGVPNWPTPARFWQVIERHRVTQFYTAPTAIRALMAEGSEWPSQHDLSSLRLLGSVGEPINEEAWQWYHRRVGGGRCPIVDTWWQTETGGILISPLGDFTPQRPAWATLPLPGVEPVLLTPEGQEIPFVPGQEAEGLLALKRPWPSLARTTWGDAERFRQTYFTAYPGYYFTGDGARRDGQGLFRITGRVDDVINVSGHRIGTAEVENALNQHPAIVESAVVGFAHDIKGQALYAFCILEPHLVPDDAEKRDEWETQLRTEAARLVTEQIGAFARPDKLQFVPNLPKTRSGKIMRRILRKIAEGDTANLGDTSTLLDPTCVAEIVAGRVS